MDCRCLRVRLWKRSFRRPRLKLAPRDAPTRFTEILKMLPSNIRKAPGARISQLLGEPSEGVPPVPIPNTEVKPCRKIPSFLSLSPFHAPRKGECPVQRSGWPAEPLSRDGQESNLLDNRGVFENLKSLKISRAYDWYANSAISGAAEQ